MMTLREKWARNIALLTGALVMFLAVIFAVLQNPSDKTPVATDKAIEKPVVVTTAAGDTEMIDAGRAVFDAQGCIRCHAVAGEGNRRNPLDGIAERRNAEGIRQWILAPTDLQDQISGWAFQAKQAYQGLPAKDIDALVIYLQSLPSQPPVN